jgi:single-stranded-DNA-specific exonuclease
MVRSTWQILAKAVPRSPSEVLSILLENRTVDRSFLSGTLRDLESHLAIRGLDQGAELTASHLAAGSQVVLVGDYDCDGITSLAQLGLFFNEIGYTNYAVVIPTRAEGYGVPKRAMLDHPEARLLITVDCGTLEWESVALARSMGADCVVIDHHELGAREAAPASVLINPKQPGCRSSFKDFCSAGLTLLFLARLRHAISAKFPVPKLGAKYQALAAVGTIADMVPLRDGNRILARCGLCHMNEGQYWALTQVLESAGIAAKTVTAGHVGYCLGPRLNAAGRMADPLVAYELLVSERPARIRELVKELNDLNARRRREEDAVFQHVKALLEQRSQHSRTLVLGSPGWAHGVVGIVASRIQRELHYGPTVILACEEHRGIAKGSARSVPGFDMQKVLRECSDLLIKWGGHQMAAGVTVALDRMDLFAERFERLAWDHEERVFVPIGRVDAELPLSMVSPRLMNLLNDLGPHGVGNPIPLFAARRQRVVVEKAFGKNERHLRLRLGEGVPGIYWRGLERGAAADWWNGDGYDVVYQLAWDELRQEPVLHIKDIGRFFA